MGAPLEFCSKRGVVAVLASGVVISLTALTGGIAPAFAKPGDNPGGPTTTVVAPEPEPQQPQAEEPEPEKKAPEPKTEVPQAPQSPAAPVTPAAPATPASPPSVAAPPKTQATESPASVEPEAQTRTPKAPPSTAVAPPVTSVATTAPSASEPTTAARTPATESEPSPASSTTRSSSPSAATTTAASEPASESSSAPSSKPSAALVEGSDASQPPSSSEASTSESASRESRTANNAEQSTSAKPTVSVKDAAKQIETVAPQTVDAPKEDVELARKAQPVFEPQPAPAAKEDVASFTSGIETSLKIPGLDVGASTKTDIGVQRRDVELASQVRQWKPDWVSYDEYYRPVILNPFHDPVRLVYMYDRAPRIVIIPPLARMVIEAAQYAAYSFTAAVLAPVVAAVNTVNAVVDTAQALTNIAVGSFFGGGYFPGVGLPLPPPPPPVQRYDNVPVFVNYSQAQYEPFRVRQIVDVGDDAQYGERKVLLDGSTPAWGQWTQSPTGERQFEIHKTQQFPGLDAPAEAPLPGDYKLRLLSDQQPDSGFTSRDIFLFVAAGVIGTLGFGAIGMAFYLGRRRPQH